jgi:mono/diheme cytochrome c family protein
MESVEVPMKVPNRRWSRIGLSLLGMLLAIQLVPYGRDHSNPPVTGEPAWDAPETRVLARQACFDCHSNETQWPLYAHIAPASWLVQHDVDEGRAVLNFSEWERPQEEAKEASETVLEGDMPPAAYKLVHAHGRLSTADRERLAQGLAKTLGVPLEAAHGRER